nr:uncharacterized protein LOC111508216 [Leptinotarsa decemlineata]
MGDFEIIETGFSSADETINFGTRSIGLGSLYEISTIGCFKSYEDESGVPSVTINCLIENGQLVLATDKSLKIFDDTKLSNLLFTAAFDSSIVSITVSPDNNFMLICLESGVVNIFHVKDRGEIFSVFTKCLPSTTEAPTIYIEGFFETQCSKVTTFIIVQGTGAIFRVSVSTKPVDQSENTFETRFEELLNLNTHITSASFSYPILLTNGAEFSVVNTETQLVLSDNSHEVKTMFSLGR